jgi:hypothetical protein
MAWRQSRLMAWRQSRLIELDQLVLLSKDDKIVDGRTEDVMLSVAPLVGWLRTGAQDRSRLYEHDPNTCQDVWNMA